MVTASVLAQEELISDGIRTPTRRDLHEGFDLWLDGLEGESKEKTAGMGKSVLTLGVSVAREQFRLPSLFDP